VPWYRTMAPTEYAVPDVQGATFAGQLTDSEPTVSSDGELPQPVTDTAATTANHKTMRARIIMCASRARVRDAAFAVARPAQRARRTVN
jgi:hypothetical protein